MNVAIRRKTQKRIWIGNRKKQQGTEVVEFAMLASLIFILLFALIEFSLMMFDQGALQHAARSGAREASLFWLNISQMTPSSDPSNDQCLHPLEVKNAITKFTDKFVFSLTGDQIIININLEGTDLSSASAPAVTKAGNTANVSLSIETGSPVTGALANLANIMSLELGAKAIMKVE